MHTLIFVDVGNVSIINILNIDSYATGLSIIFCFNEHHITQYTQSHIRTHTHTHTHTDGRTGVHKMMVLSHTSV